MMNSIGETIWEYKTSCQILLNRIKELDILISQAGEDSESYTQRRLALYTEMWDMQRAILEMEEYEDSVRLKVKAQDIACQAG